MPRTGDLQLDAKIKSMALAFGIDHIVIDERPVSAPDATVFTDMTALARHSFYDHRSRATGVNRPALG